ncbi:MAG: 4'-phosphopantetheinyl transferase superfamily protein [Beijerinckiaceae bacterium]|nr:4'-phosphopantetheinyl transferase superfamily protein [Beijerinckiaceae bacterium]
MIWLHALDETATSLPAVWLIASRRSPANLPERSALRRGIAHELIARQFSLPPQAVTIEHDEAGRPVLARPAGTGLHLSLATRAGLVAVALARAPVGVDVERIEPAVPPPLASLHSDERERLAMLPEAARPLAFAQIWTAKEAYVKALGTGFLRPPESFAVTLLTGGRFKIDDPERPTGALGHGLIDKNGGQGSLAAAMIVLD